MQASIQTPTAAANHHKHSAAAALSPHNPPQQTLQQTNSMQQSTDVAVSNPLRQKSSILAGTGVAANDVAGEDESQNDSIPSLPRVSHSEGGES